MLEIGLVVWDISGGDTAPPPTECVTRQTPMGRGLTKGWFLPWQQFAFLLVLSSNSVSHIMRMKMLYIGIRLVFSEAFIQVALGLYDRFKYRSVNHKVLRIVIHPHYKVRASSFTHT